MPDPRDACLLQLSRHLLLFARAQRRSVPAMQRTGGAGPWLACQAAADQSWACSAGGPSRAAAPPCSQVCLIRRLSHQVQQLLQLCDFHLGALLNDLAFLRLQREQVRQSCEQGGLQGGLLRPSSQPSLEADPRGGCTCLWLYCKHRVPRDVQKPPWIGEGATEGFGYG